MKINEIGMDMEINAENMKTLSSMVKLCNELSFCIKEDALLGKTYTYFLMGDITNKQTNYIKNVFERRNFDVEFHIFSDHVYMYVGWE